MDDLFQEPIHWRRPLFRKKHIVGTATHSGQELAVRINDFPDEPMFTLIGPHGQMDFDNWPVAWGNKPY